ncbi:MAG: hypothetical protein ACLTKE_09840 [Coprococcus sp.]
MTLPMILPPTVVGFFLLLLLETAVLLEVWLSEHGMPVVFSFAGTVIASGGRIVSIDVPYCTKCF